MTTHRFRARWVFPGDREPIENGTLEVADGRVTAVHARYDRRAIDLGSVAVIPGLVNAHTHLEFSTLLRPLEPALPCTAWIRRVVAARRDRAESLADVIEAGLREVEAAGTSTVGEIATEDGVAPLLASYPGAQGVVFRELIGLLPQRTAEQAACAAAHLQRETSENRVRAGLSPHAPYSVHPDLFHECIRLARTHNAPVAMHLAETRAELELLAHGAGEFAEMLREFGIWRDGLLPRGLRPMDYLRPLSDVERALVIHGNYLAEDELEFISAHDNLSVVYCPRTHAYFGHDPHPWRGLLERGCRVALGTDSRASNPDLNLWNEVLFLRRRHPDVDPRTLLAMATVNGALALGFGDDTGTLALGSVAEFALVALPDDGPNDPWSILFSSGSRIIGTQAIAAGDSSCG